MPNYYTADYLYNDFKELASMRKSNPAYANDSTYWDDGHCNWGGQHQLREDCETIARGMAKLESLDSESINNELNKCLSQSEHDSKKQNYIRKANEVSSQLQVRTGYSSSMFGICCIWSQEGMNQHVESKMQECRRKLEDLKSQLGQNNYQHIEKLRHLQLEQKKIEARMKQRRREAEREKDPAKKAAILLLIENDAKELEDNLRQQQAIPKSGINFNPREYVDKIINGIREALKEKAGGGSGSGGGSGRPGKPRKPGEPNEPFGGGGGNDPDDNQDPNKPPPGKRPEKQEKDNSQMLLIAVAVIVILFLMMNQKEKPSREYEEDYY